MLALVLGGTRSGKSELAERWATSIGAPVTYLATAEVYDDDFAARIDLHRRRRPSDWSTVETGDDLVGALRQAAGTVLVDSLGTWLARHHDFVVDGAALCAALRGRGGATIVVSEEVGLGVHAPTELGRLFSDRLGTLNQQVAAIADRAVFVVAGRVLELRPQEPWLDQVTRG